MSAHLLSAKNNVQEAKGKVLEAFGSWICKRTLQTNLEGMCLPFPCSFGVMQCEEVPLSGPRFDSRSTGAPCHQTDLHREGLWYRRLACSESAARPQAVRNAPACHSLSTLSVCATLGRRSSKPMTTYCTNSSRYLQNSIDQCAGFAPPPWCGGGYRGLPASDP